MRNLINFLLKYNHWLLFVLLEVISFVLLFRFNNYQGSVFFTSANRLSGAVYDAVNHITRYFSLADINSDLTRRNVELEIELERLTEQLQRYTRDTTSLDKLRQESLKGYRLFSARVTNNSVTHPNNFITIDKGLADGVRKDMGVACGNGVVGVVYMVSAHYAVVIPLLNSKSNVSVTIRKRGYYGYLHWTGGAADLAYVDDVPRHARFALGDLVETSGYSSIFPPGIIVGQILHVYNSRDGLSYRIQVKLTTDFGNLRDVCVIDNTAMEERIDLLRSAQDSLKLKQN